MTSRTDHLLSKVCAGERRPGKRATDEQHTRHDKAHANRKRSTSRHSANDGRPSIAIKDHRCRRSHRQPSGVRVHAARVLHFARNRCVSCNDRHRQPSVDNGNGTRRRSTHRHRRLRLTRLIQTRLIQLTSSEVAGSSARWRCAPAHVLEASEMPQEGKLHRGGRTVAVFGNDHFCHALGL